MQYSLRFFPLRFQIRSTCASPKRSPSLHGSASEEATLQTDEFLFNPLEDLLPAGNIALAVAKALRASSFFGGAEMISGSLSDEDSSLSLSSCEEELLESLAQALANVKIDVDVLAPLVIFSDVLFVTFKVNAMTSQNSFKTVSPTKTFFKTFKKTFLCR